MRAEARAGRGRRRRACGFGRGARALLGGWAPPAGRPARLGWAAAAPGRTLMATFSWVSLSTTSHVSPSPPAPSFFTVVKNSPKPWSGSLGGPLVTPLALEPFCWSFLADDALASSGALRHAPILAAGGRAGKRGWLSDDAGTSHTGALQGPAVPRAAAAGDFRAPAGQGSRPSAPERWDAGRRGRIPLPREPRCWSRAAAGLASGKRAPYLNAPPTSRERGHPRFGLLAALRPEQPLGS